MNSSNQKSINPLSSSKTSCDSTTFSHSPTATTKQPTMIDEMLDGNMNKTLTVTRLPVYASKFTEYLIGDAIVACAVTFGVAPFITVIDKAIVQRAAGSHTIVQSSIESVTKITKNPIKFVKSPMFLMMWGVYAATYTTANTLKTIMEKKSQQASNIKEKQRDDNWGKTSIFVGTTIVNSTTTLMKDQAYARMFGAVGTSARVPLISYGLWASRDCMVIGSSFILPEIVGKSLEQQGMEKSRALTLSQLACPILTQVVAGPVQLLGLDFYNRPMNHLTYTQATKERILLLGNKFFSIVGARIARIAPAYGIGGVGNTILRNEWRKKVDERAKYW